jgi:UPF0716 family protein affecting phage T7 exclusion
MCLVISIFLMFYLYIEISLFGLVASSIGGIWVFYEIILSIMLGNYFISRFNQNPPQTEQQMKTMPIRLLGAFLLMIPGIFTDVLGILCLMPGVNLLLVWLIGQYAKGLMDQGRLRSFVYTNYSSSRAHHPSDEHEQMRLQSDYQNARDVFSAEYSSASADSSREAAQNLYETEQSQTSQEQSQVKPPKIIKVKGKKIE